MHKAHLANAVIFLLVFLATGVYMKSGFPELYAGREEIRMMFRATHIYILMASLINFVAANYLSLVANQTSFESHKAVWKWLAYIASVLILITPALFTLAFFIEPAAYLIERPITFGTVVLLFAGVILQSVLCFAKPAGNK